MGARTRTRWPWATCEATSPARSIWCCAPRTAASGSDYKSNKVGARDEVLTAETYTAGRLAQEIAAATYDRQYTLYTLALHRFLGARMPEAYDGTRAAYESKVGGVLYLFLRGMLGPEHPHLGVHYDVVPWATIERLDSLLGQPELT